MKDYSDRVNNHEDYLKLLNNLEKKTREIEYVLIDDDQTFVNAFSQEILFMNLKRKWWGTKSSHQNKVYRLKATKDIFRYLRRFETFCKYEISEKGDQVIETDFGINDIAFFDSQKEPLLYVTAHEGYIMIREDLLKDMEMIL